MKTTNKIRVSLSGYSGGREYYSNRESARLASIDMLSSADAFSTVKIEAVTNRRSRLIGEVSRNTDWLETEGQITETFKVLNKG